MLWIAKITVLYMTKWSHFLILYSEIYFTSKWILFICYFSGSLPITWRRNKYKEIHPSTEPLGHAKTSAKGRGRNPRLNKTIPSVICRLNTLRKSDVFNNELVTFVLFLLESSLIEIGKYDAVIQVWALTGSIERVYKSCTEDIPKHDQT